MQQYPTLESPKKHEVKEDPSPVLRKIGRIKVVPSGMTQVRIQLAMFDDTVPRYELAMPTMNFMRLLLGGLFID